MKKSLAAVPAAAPCSSTWWWLLALGLLALTACAQQRTIEGGRAPAMTGRDIVVDALNRAEIVQAPGTRAIVSALISDTDVDLQQPLEGLTAKKPLRGRKISFPLADGTRLGGMIFERQGPDAIKLPFLMVGLGFLQDRWGTEAGRFYRNYIENPERSLPVHILVLDHCSSGPFLAENGVLSIGSYDEARMWIEVARNIRKKFADMPIHLFGLSTSGQAVIHALAEDRRLGLNLFDSGLAVSVPSDLQRAPGRQLALLDADNSAGNPWNRYAGPGKNESLLDRVQKNVLLELIDRQFLPNYKRVNPGHTRFSIPHSRAAAFFYEAFSNRIILLREQQRIPDTWNYSAAPLDTLENYMQSTGIALVIDQVHTPLVLLNAANDSVAAPEAFLEVQKAAARNPWVLCHQTALGGHSRIADIYGSRYLARLLELMTDRDLIERWNRPMEPPPVD